MMGGLWSGRLPGILGAVQADTGCVDEKKVVHGTTAFLVRSLDGGALQFSLPVRMAMPEAVSPDLAVGADGAAALIIEEIKESVNNRGALRPIGGLDTPRPANYAQNTEPVTCISTSPGTGSSLWKADASNTLQEDKLRLLLRGALPWPGSPEESSGREIADALSLLIRECREIAAGIPEDRLEEACRLSIDQKDLRARLPELGMVCFIGDGSRPARNFTHFRASSRMAGPKLGVNIPFICPEELRPVEVELAGSGESITGLGIRRGEVLAIAGSNAQGKSTLLQAIMAGEDDHARGDGREHLVSTRRIATAEAGGTDLSGSDISLFFRRLPPGVSGTPRSAFGRGSGSMVMAERFQDAIRKEAPLLLIDEDRSATNLLVPGCIQTEEVSPLSTVIATRREELGDTAIIFAASAMDILIAEADRIMLLERHVPRAIQRGWFREKLSAHLRALAEALDQRKESPSQTSLPPYQDHN